MLNWAHRNARQNVLCVVIPLQSQTFRTRLSHSIGKLMVTSAFTILLSSFLLFLVQPIVAKQILPWFGGSQSVWTICLVFFQIVLLLGYLYAHLLTKRGAGSRQFLVHILLLLASCLTLPIIPAIFWKPTDGAAPALQILGLLAATVGLPYFLLASTAPLLQRWLSTSSENPVRQRSIYRLFALSNFGSLIGLLSYPFAVEPLAPVRMQAWIWSGAYVVFVACLARYAWRRRLRPEAEDSRALEAASAPAPSRGEYAYWIGCAALGSVLLLSVTNQITQNIASIPLLWIVPLTIYLLSFVICFEGRGGRGWYIRRYWMTPAMLATAAMAWALFANQANLSIYAALPIDLCGLFFGCVACHGELARSKPHPQYLTSFYLSLAAGGALGGMFVGLIAPLIFSNYWEMPLALIGLCVLGLHACFAEARISPRTSWSINLLTSVLAAALALALLGGLPSVLDKHALEWQKILAGDARWGCLALLVLYVLLLQRYSMFRAVALTALLCTLAFDWSYAQGLSEGTRIGVRNFYGALRVTESSFGQQRVRRLLHGVILHGWQFTDPPLSLKPTSYYTESSGIGLTLLSKHRTNGALRIGSIGLGAGTMAAHARAGDVFRVYELNPAVLDLARSQFTYLRDSKAQIEPVLGDARLSLEVELARGDFDRPELRFDVLSVDAFSGDAIPTHLLTREALAIYTRVVKPDGVIAFHVSNRYLDLPPVVGKLARDAGFRAALVTARTKDLDTGSVWVLVTHDGSFLQQPELAPRITPIPPRADLSVWTDQFSNLVQILMSSAPL